MSDDFVFSSERLEQQAQRRKWLLPLLVLAGIILLSAVIALIVASSRRDVHTDGADTPYPFTWQTESDGTLLLNIPHDGAPDHRWIAEEDSDSPHVLTVRREPKDKGGKTRFTLSPVEAGRTILDLALCRENDELDRIYRMRLLVECADNDGMLECSILSAAGKQLSGAASGGEGTENPYRIYQNDRGYVIVAVTCAPEENDWTVELVSGEASVASVAFVYEEGEQRLYLTGGEADGPSELLLKSEAAAVTLRLRFEQTDGALLIQEHHADYGQKQPVTTTELPLPDPFENEEDAQQLVSTAPLEDPIAD